MNKNTTSKNTLKITTIKRVITQYMISQTPNKTNTFSKMKPPKILSTRIIIKNLISKITNNHKSQFKMKNQSLKTKTKIQININYLRKKVQNKKIDNLIKN